MGMHECTNTLDTFEWSIVVAFSHAVFAVCVCVNSYQPMSPRTAVKMINANPMRRKKKKNARARAPHLQ